MVSTIDDFIKLMSDGNEEVSKLIREFLRDKISTNILFDAYELGIWGENFLKLYKDCSDGDIEKLEHTIIVLKNKGYTDSEINTNLSLDKPEPFVVTNSALMEENNVHNGYFGPLMNGWNKFIEQNRKIVIPNIEQKYIDQNLGKMTHNR